MREAIHIYILCKLLYLTLLPFHLWHFQKLVKEKTSVSQSGKGELLLTTTRNKNRKINLLNSPKYSHKCNPVAQKKNCLLHKSWLIFQFKYTVKKKCASYTKRKLFLWVKNKSRLLALFSIIIFLRLLRTRKDNIKYPFLKFFSLVLQYRID